MINTAVPNSAAGTILPAWTLWLLLTVVAAILLGAALVLKRSFAGNRAGTGEERDWSIPELQPEPVVDYLFHRWDPRIKLVSLFAYAFFVVSVRTLEPASAAALISACAAVLARVPKAGLMKRMAGISGFICVLVLVMPLTVRQHPGDLLVTIDGLDFLQINVRGLILALTIGLKAMAVAALMEPMLATAPLTKTVEALSRLGVSTKLTQMVLLSHRYIHVFVQEAGRMQTAMKARGFSKRTDARTLRTVANFLGMLFVRSFDRTYRVHDAMLARGFRGRFPDHHSFQAKPADWFLACVFLGTGVLLVLLDRGFIG